MPSDCVICRPRADCGFNLLLISLPFSPFYWFPLQLAPRSASPGEGGAQSVKCAGQLNKVPALARLISETHRIERLQGNGALLLILLIGNHYMRTLKHEQGVSGRQVG